MPKAKDTKVWNEDLAKALQARADMARRQGKRSVVTFTEGCNAIVAVRADIYAFSNGRIVGLPSNKLSKTVDELCRQIITGKAPIYPPGHVPHEAGAEMEGNPYLLDHYCKTIKKRGGAFAILMAFHVSQNKTLTKKQIIETGQHFCDEEMEENFHAGRTRGAWAGNAQLQKHGLITVQKNVTYNERAGGLRNNGVHTYTLTSNGQLFIDALLELNPNIRQQIDAVGARTMNKATANAHDVMSRTAAATVQNPYVRHKGPFLATSKTPSKSNKFSAQDEQELREWARTAAVGQQKEFRVGKDRRKSLHDVCDSINLDLSGRQLRHQSEGDARSRSLFVTMVATMNIPSTNPSIDHGQINDSLPVKTSPPRLLSRGRLLDEESPMKRQVVVPPRQAAALAALERQAFRESIEASKKSNATASVKPYPRLIPVDQSPTSFSRPTARKNLGFSSVDVGQNLSSTGNIIDLLNDSSDEEMDKKPPASKPSVSQNLLLDDDDDDDSILESVLFSTKTKNDMNDGVDGMIIYIDDRERNRNHTPRQLRTELSRLLSNGQLAMVWPVKPMAKVVEKHLRSGDFSYSFIRGDVELPLPVLVERKRIGDLVQRSTKKDHWYQLQTMRWASKVSFILLEGDPRTCTQFIPYDAQEVEVPCPYSHTIDDEDSLYLFMGRAILNDRSGSTMFVQAKDEQSSLRFVGSIGLMALSCIRSEDPPGVNFDVKQAIQALSKKLRDLGIPSQLVARLADEFIDIKCLDVLYGSMIDPQARDLVLSPILEDLCDDLETAKNWSRVVHRAWSSTGTATEGVVERFHAISHLVEKRALLLSKLYEGLSNDEAVNAIFETSVKEQPCSRQVVIRLPVDCMALFPSPRDRGTSFFRLETRPDSSKNLPCISIRTVAFGFSSPSIHIFLLDGKQLVEILQRKLKYSSDCVIAARSSSKEIQASCQISGLSAGDKRILLVKALGNAVDQAAKTPDFRFETRALVEMVQSELMLRHRIVVMQALRVKDDQDMILRQLALACFRFQLVTGPVKSELHHGAVA